jgi:hypothetical protein
MLPRFSHEAEPALNTPFERRSGRGRHKPAHPEQLGFDHRHRRTRMKTLLTGTFLVLTLASGQALAETPAAPSKPATTAVQPATPAADASTDAKFKAADKNGSGALETTEADPYKAVMAKVDTNKDGKISQDEFMSGSKAGLIK